VEIDKSLDKKGKRESSTHSKREKRQRDENVGMKQRELEMVIFS